MNQEEIEKLVAYLNSHQIKNTVLFYNRLFNDLMLKSKEFFVNRNIRTANVLMMKFVEVLIANRNEKVVPTEITTKSLSEKEIAGTQYMGGYVLRKVFYSINNKIKTDYNKQAQSMVSAGRTLENRGTFVDDLSRGDDNQSGLWKISEDMERIFIITQKYFTVQTAEPGLRVINIPLLVDKLMKYPPLILTYEKMAADNDVVDKTVIINVLSSILTLFLKVRVFSHVKVLTAKHKKNLSSKRALRKTLKETQQNE